jgi:hypothetical protein
MAPQRARADGVDATARLSRVACRSCDALQTRQPRIRKCGRSRKTHRFNAMVREDRARIVSGASCVRNRRVACARPDRRHLLVGVDASLYFPNAYSPTQHCRYTTEFAPPNNGAMPTEIRNARHRMPGIGLLLIAAKPPARGAPCWSMRWSSRDVDLLSIDDLRHKVSGAHSTTQPFPRATGLQPHVRVAQTRAQTHARRRARIDARKDARAQTHAHGNPECRPSDAGHRAASY